MTRVFGASLVVGVLVMAVGVSIAWVEPDRVQPRALATWVLGAALVHDLVFVPVGLAFAWGVRRALRGRPSVLPVIAGAAALAVVVGGTFPIWRAYARAPANPSLLPLDYRWGLAAAAGAVILCTLAAAWWTRRSAAGRPGLPVQRGDGTPDAARPGH